MCEDSIATMCKVPHTPIPDQRTSRCVPPSALRKLTNRCRHVERKLERQNIIQQYTNFDSQVYAPMTRTGVYPDSGSDRFNVKNRFTSTLDGECTAH